MITLDTKKLEYKLEQIIDRLDSIESKLKVSDTTSNGYISEFDAKKKLKRGTTWFWNQRKAGLPSFKVGGQVYYKEDDLYSFFKLNNK